MESYRNLLQYIILVLLILIVTYGLVKLYPIYIILLKFLGKLLFPFVLAALISYILHPILVKSEKWNIKRPVAILLIFGLFIFFGTALIYKSLPAMIYELEELSEQLPVIIETYEQMILSLYESTSFLPEEIHRKMDVIIASIEFKLDQKITNILGSVMKLSDIIVLFAIIPVLVFYFLKDYDIIIVWLGKLVPNRFRKKYFGMIKAVDESLGNYIRGQLLISLSITLITYAIYHLFDMKYALLLAIFMGVMNVIPYFGPIIGTIPAALISMTVSTRLVIIIIVANALIQLLESSILSPYIMGKSIKIHPIFLIFILLIGAELGGILGMIIVVPAVTIIRGIIHEFILIDHQKT